MMAQETLEIGEAEQKAIDGIESAETYEYSLKVQVHSGR